MKTTRKIIALFLAIVMATACMSVCASALPSNNITPSIFIPGLFQCETKVYDENGQVMTDSFGNPLAEPFFLPNTIDIVGAALTDVLVPISKLLINQEDKDKLAANALADLLGETLMGKNKSDENGKFIYDVRATKYNVSVAELSKADQDTILDHFPLEYYIENYGAESLFFFSYASMGNMIDVANELYDYIKMVKKQTNSDKVNIIPVSQGGSIMNALMQLYIDNGELIQDDVSRIVYVVPALDGSLIIGEAYEYGFLDENVELYDKMFPALLGENDVVSYLINILLRIMPNADLNTILDVAVDTLVNDYMKYSTLMWGLCPADNYVPTVNAENRIGAREKYLSDEGSAEIRKQADWYHIAQLNSDANILAAMDNGNGVEVFNIAEFNVPLFHLVDSYDDLNADGIIHLDSTSMGAYSVGVKTELPADYNPDDHKLPVSNCNDPTHNHIDPTNVVDAGAGLLPDTTFYFDGQDHEKTASNDVIMKLVTELLVDENFHDVYYTEGKFIFPQFNGARNTKSLMKDVKEMKNYDYSEIGDPNIVYEMKEAIAQAEMMLDNMTIIDAEVSAAKERFYRARDAVYNYSPDGTTDEVEKENGAYLDFMPLLSDLIMFLSKLLYNFFGGDGFSEM